MVKTDNCGRTPESGQQGHGARIIHSCPKRSLISKGFSPMLISNEACECRKA